MAAEKGKHAAPKKSKAKKTPAKSTENSGRKRQSGKKPYLIAAAAILLIIVLAVAGGILAGHSSVIHPNLCLNGIDIGGLTVEQASAKLSENGWEETQKNSTVKVILPAGYEFTVTAEEVGLNLDCRAAAQAAYDYGHSGNPASDLAAYFKCITGTADTGDIFSDLNDDLIRERIETELSELQDILDNGYIVDTEAETLSVVKGAELVTVDTDKLYELITEAFAEGKDEVKYDVVASGTPESIDFSAIRDEIYAEAKDAEYDTKTHSATEHTVGIDLDVDEAERLWNEAGTGDLVVIPLIVTQPEFTTEQLDAKLFSDVLGSQKSSYKSSDSGRANNVELAAAKINGVILNPGEEFSYNDVVGKRTEAAGFKSASIYENGRVSTGIGGGICQVSSNLYCAAIYANLDITVRTNHYFAVSYLPVGFDATVSWGGPEFKFVNNRDYPVKIVATCKNRELTVQILGTDVDGSYVEITYSTGTVYDKTYPTVAIGTTADTYRCVYDKDGTLQSRTHEAHSYYHYHDENIVWPSESPEVTASPEPSASPTVSPTEEPVPPSESPVESQTVEP